MIIRNSKPTKGNKFYITKSKGGYSLCIQGYPTDKYCNVLSNCVGYACGRFNEIIGSMKYPELNCNAENFIERAKQLGLKVQNKPVQGGIMVWQVGSLKNSDGAGHVAVVEKVINNKTVFTSESNYGGAAFFNVTRSNSNGRWGCSSSFKYRGCIVNPAIKNNPKKEKVDQILHVGSKVQFDGIFKVDILKLPLGSNLFGCTQLTGCSVKNYKNGKCKSYDWLKANDFIECDKKGNKTKDQLLTGGKSYVKNSKTYEVKQIIGDSAMIHVSGYDSLIKAKYLREV